MKKFNFSIRGNKYDVKVNAFEGSVANIEVNGTTYEVEIHQEVVIPKTPRLVRKPVDVKPGEGEIKKSGQTGFTVKAPLPGSLFKIHVGVGDIVAKGDCLLIMEAMKMENNILAEKAGTIKAIKVNLGDTVLQGDVLLEIV